MALWLQSLFSDKLISLIRYGVYALVFFVLIIVEGNLTGQRYIDQILTTVVIPYIGDMGKDAVFMDDNAHPHRARIMDTCLRQQEWTGQHACSPDLNPIEHVWDQIGRAVRQRLNINSTLVDLRRYMLEEWDRLPMANLQRLIHSMRIRCDARDVMPALLQPVELHVTELYQC